MVFKWPETARESHLWFLMYLGSRSSRSVFLALLRGILDHILHEGVAVLGLEPGEQTSLGRFHLLVVLRVRGLLVLPLGAGDLVPDVTEVVEHVLDHVVLGLSQPDVVVEVEGPAVTRRSISVEDSTVHVLLGVLVETVFSEVQPFRQRRVAVLADSVGVVELPIEVLDLAADQELEVAVHRRGALRPRVLAGDTFVVVLVTDGQIGFDDGEHGRVEGVVVTRESDLLRHCHFLFDSVDDLTFQSHYLYRSSEVPGTLQGRAEGEAPELQPKAKRGATPC